MGCQQCEEKEAAEQEDDMFYSSLLPLEISELPLGIDRNVASYIYGTNSHLFEQIV